MPAPAALRPFLRFAKLPPRALAVARKALDGDAEFRSRVAEVASEEDVGRPGWLYLTRPDGWQDELATFVAEAENVAREAADRRAEHDARRRLGAVEAAARRADELAAAARAEAAEAATALAEERRARLAAVEEAAASARRIEDAIRERDAAREQVAAAQADVESLRRRLAEVEAEGQALRARVEQLEASPAPPVPAAAPEAPPLPSPAPALADAAEAASVLAARLRAAIAALEAPPDRPPAASLPASPLAPPHDVLPQPASVPPSRPAPRPQTPSRARRQPVVLPPAVFDDSVEAAEHLVRVPSAVLVVDGYNVSLTGWPELTIAEQRRRLVDALAELAARSGADVRVVFDGSEMAMPGIVPTTARAVRVSFSPPGVEADDVVLDLVAQLPVHRPVIVASNDRRVQQGARRAGANVLTTDQLLAVLRR